MSEWKPACSRAALLVVLAATTVAHAQTSSSTYPAKLVRIIVPASPGGGTDIVTRMLAQKLSENLHQTFLVENRPGAGQMLGTEAVARASNDGYTLLMSASALVLNQALSKEPRFDTLRDFAPITLVGSLPNILVVHPSLPVKTVMELITLARSKPGALNYSSGGNATTLHLSMELFRFMSRTAMVHIPYKGAGPATGALVAGHVELSMPPALAAIEFVRAGRLRALGVTSGRRIVVLPNVPTIAEAGVSGYEAIFWYGLLAPAGTPRAIATRLHSEVVKALPDVGKFLAADGAQAVGSSPEEFAAFIKSEFEKWSRVGREAKVSLD